MTTLAQDALALKRLKAKRDKTKAAYEDLDRDYKIAMARFKERLEVEKVDSIKAGGVNFVPAETRYATMQDRAAFVKWALANDSGLVEYKERKDQLNALVNARLDNGEPLPPGLGYYVREYISQRAG